MFLILTKKETFITKCNSLTVDDIVRTNSETVRSKWKQLAPLMLNQRVTNRVIAMLCHRDFEPIVAQFGDVNY